jgi:hypothetical protein
VEAKVTEAKVNLFLTLPHYFRVVGVEYSYAGNLIIMTHEKCIAEDLMAHVDTIASCIAPDESYWLMDKRPDMDFHHVKVNGIPTDNGQGDMLSPANVSCELGQVFEAYKNMNHAIPPAWMGLPMIIKAKPRASMAFSFTTAEEANHFLSARVFYLFGYRCFTSQYEDQAPLYYCGNCGSYAHKYEHCWSGRHCLICTNPEGEHCTVDHPENEPAKCINCQKAHCSTDKNCPECCRRLGLAVLGSQNPKPPPSKTPNPPGLGKSHQGKAAQLVGPPPSPTKYAVKSTDLFPEAGGSSPCDFTLGDIQFALNKKGGVPSAPSLNQIPVDGPKDMEP